ncbi:hypothetical protein Godav_025646 [Gossypium davidsonii]|uniref:Uncharacterized protein n=1 Tax=Gossypium davidsonii TaxID=34287 RepID=A0A7J8TJV9_GOSDV|nr:hypothetical protein [Gossypium davidsonii]
MRLYPYCRNSKQFRAVGCSPDQAEGG